MAIASTVIGGAVLIYVEPLHKWLLGFLKLRIPMWSVLIVMASAMGAVRMFFGKRRDSQSHDSRESVKTSQRDDRLSEKELVQVTSKKAEHHGPEQSSAHAELSDLEIAILVGLAQNPPYDRTARGFAVDHGASEGLAEYHLENLRGFGFIRLRGFVAGGGYELTQKGRAYLVNKNLI